MEYEFEIENEIITTAKTEDEFLKIFNDKLATLILYYEGKNNVGALQ